MSTPAAAEQTSQQKLTALQQKIHSLQQQLEQDNQQKDHAVYQLKQVETAIAEHAGELRKINRDINESQQQLASLQGRREALQLQLASHRSQLARQVKAAFVLGRQEYIKLLLNQQNPATVARMVTYYQYFNTARAESLNTISRHITELNDIGEQTTANKSRLQSLKKQLVEDKRQLEKRRQQRKQLVAKLSERAQNKDQLLQGLKRDEQHLKQLLNQLQQPAPTPLPQEPAVFRKFATLKGQLAWPVSGELSARFGAPRQGSRLKWKGVMISTTSGDDIRAIADGRVVYADWLRGFGMLVIVDHADGYMSLYGHNEQLHVKLGDSVRRNDVIASAGNSGGQKLSNLYFEIRHNGVPQNPAKWCKSLPGQG
ncbi:MAG: peptidoglycan DD-metalloendopeptidase family protein [Gammaproteobacteria bacterium]